jgi:hypothetical protein
MLNEGAFTHRLQVAGPKPEGERHFTIEQERVASGSVQVPQLAYAAPAGEVDERVRVDGVADQCDVDEIKEASKWKRVPGVTTENEGVIPTLGVPDSGKT